MAVAVCACILLCASSLCAQASSAQPASGVATARLMKGPEAVRGLPFFGPNAIAALAGEYAVGTYRLSVYSCRGPVYLGAGWKAVSMGERPAVSAFLLAGPPSAVVALKTDRYTLFIGLPEDLPALRRFSLALEDRFSSFFDNAPTDAELSFPAYVDYRP
jgi:hypothetical protein